MKSAKKYRRVPIILVTAILLSAGVAELAYPSTAECRLPLVVFLHGSARNDMNQTLPGGRGSTFVPLAQAAGRADYATLRFNKRGVTDIGPVRTTDPARLKPEKPYHRIQQDAAAVSSTTTATAD
jgi:hypothetical protein